jgi:hypothetical protein
MTTSLHDVVQQIGIVITLALVSERTRALQAVKLIASCSGFSVNDIKCSLGIRWPASLHSANMSSLTCSTANAPMLQPCSRVGSLFNLLRMLS